MEQRDIIKDEIEQLGKVLGRIIANFLGLKSKGQVSQGIEITVQKLQSELDIDTNKLITLSRKKLTEYLQKRKLTAEHIEILADYLKETGKIEIERDSTEAKIKLEKALELLEITDEISSTESFERMNKKDGIGKLIEQCK